VKDFEESFNPEKGAYGQHTKRGHHHD
jgi:hypothetical protein